MTLPTGARPPLDLARLQQTLGAAYDVEVVEASPSTNALVSARAREGAPAGLVVVAEHQTAGRGRLDRTWSTPARAALTFSVLLRPALESADWPWLPLLTGVAVARGLREAGADAGLKWPNDVLVGERKVAGLLAERVETATGPAAVLGIGLNVSTTRAELPVGSATSLALAGVEVDRTELLAGLLTSLRREYDVWQASAGGVVRAGLHAAYTDLCTTLGRPVRVDLPSGETLEGTAAAIAPSGALVVDTGSGRVSVAAGDVIHVRPLGTTDLTRSLP